MYTDVSVVSSAVQRERAREWKTERNRERQREREGSSGGVV